MFADEVSSVQHAQKKPQNNRMLLVPERVEA